MLPQKNVKDYTLLKHGSFQFLKLQSLYQSAIFQVTDYLIIKKKKDEERKLTFIAAATLQIMVFIHYI